MAGSGGRAARLSAWESAGAADSAGWFAVSASEEMTSTTWPVSPLGPATTLASASPGSSPKPIHSVAPVPQAESAKAAAIRMA